MRAAQTIRAMNERPPQTPPHRRRRSHEERPRARTHACGNRESYITAGRLMNCGHLCKIASCVSVCLSVCVLGERQSRALIYDSGRAIHSAATRRDEQLALAAI